MISSQDVRDLVDVGFIAWSRGLNLEAARIFEAVRLARPEQEAGHLGAALVLLRQGDPAGAADLLRRLPPTHAARTFLGLALLRLGEKDEGLDLLQDVVDHAAGAPAGRLARSLIEGR